MSEKLCWGRGTEVGGMGTCHFYDIPHNYIEDFCEPLSCLSTTNQSCLQGISAKCPFILLSSDTMSPNVVAGPTRHPSDLPEPSNANGKPQAVFP